MISSLPNGATRFRVFLPHASSVQVVGTFTDWRNGAIAMDRQHPGWWEVEVQVEKGEHQFCYLVDGHLWLADYAAHGVKLNGYGGWVSRLEVEAAPVGVCTSDRADAPLAVAA